MKWQLPTLIALAIFLSFWHFGRPDIITDESSYATRAVGMVDFDFGIEQPTPWQWVSGQPPWWMHLSFHDHPPLVFLLQHYSIKLFGETPFAVRLPSVLAGIAAVWLLYLIGKQLYSPAIGLASAALFAFTVNHVFISRIGLQESVAIAFMLASAYCFLRTFQPRTPVVSIGQSTGTSKNLAGIGLEKGSRWWCIASGVFLGLAFLAKYHTLSLIPIFATLAIFTVAANRIDRSYLRRLWNQTGIAALLFLAIASPVVIYNIQLYRNFGHFDFQFAQLLRQNVKEWPAHPGQDVLGSYSDRIRAFVPRLIEANSPYFLILSTIGLLVVIYELIRRRAFIISHSSLVIIFIWLLPFLVFIGPAHRFLTLLTPWLAIAAGYGTGTFFERIRKPTVQKLAFTAFAALVAFEAWYSYNSVVALDPVGSRPWAYSYLHRQAGSWGFNELNTYLDRELGGKMPDPAVTFEFPFAHELLAQARAEGSRWKLQPVPVGIVYNDNINLSSQLWVFLRRIAYHGWPVANAADFRRGGADQFFRQSGITHIYFVNPTVHALQDRTRPPSPDGDIMEGELKARGITPTEIRNPRGKVAFRVYQFQLQ